MSNTWFRFKQFTINQKEVGMKVGTDGVLLGAWTTVPIAGRILDIGAGTGLLALMLAQRSTGSLIDAIEIDGGSCNQALENIENSSWKERIKLFHTSLQDFSLNNRRKYDLIITNPPYFSDDSSASSESRSLARQDFSLPKRILINNVIRLLAPGGVFSCILPYEGNFRFTDIAAEYGMHPRRILNVKPTPEKKIVRVLFEFEQKGNSLTEETIIIESNGRHNYSDEYKELTKDFYLNF